MASAGAGMTERERDGCRELLELLQTDDLLALADTVTSRLVQPSNRQEAINVILLYSQSTEELLKRKKVFREIIFKYLAMKGVILPPSSEKHQLVYRAKEYWCEELKVSASEQTYTNLSIQQQEDGRTQGDQDDIKECHNLAEEFCQWYFRMLNSQNPLIGEPQQEWGPQHFWADVTLKFCYHTSEQNMEEYSGAELVSLRLLSLVKEEYLFLNPNLNAGGLKCTVSPYGLVVVAVAGTVHRSTCCLGIFEQIFGLIRCPFRENTWKIKFVNLKIVGQNAIEPGTHIERPSIKYEQEELQEFYVSKELALIEPQKY
ncbi:PREDICTED: uncharacterized protein C3orf38 homolog [Thamnophis sirtalis]|uniref:Uncharacterized protein C3orf38 homolog n=1 Tax=Thamnophis sirtalis TaxID=35019 RepID=A0A6I9X1N4_9SAUR|nr:PREDICTED: uncharacterized protein C3orf38 homolog [Thamnophis sirtalis]XP_032075411.1 uncharacterized protein C3orf38 homolog [Thamnophis elegans]